MAGRSPTPIHLQAILDTAVDGIIVADGDGNILRFNQACERLFGYTAEEVHGQNIKMLMPASYASEHDGYIENYKRTGEAKIIGIGREVVARKKGGGTFPIRLSVGEAEDNGDTIFVGILCDLTERRETEARLRQVQRLEAIGQLTGGIAHDFNNLLAIIIGNIESLVEAPNFPATLTRPAREALSASERGANLVQRLLAFARRQQLEPRAFNANERLPEVVRLLSRTLGETIRIESLMGSDLWDAVADPTMVDDALINLAINARDAMPNGGKLIFETANAYLDEDYARSHLELSSGEYVMLAVTDTGVGMKPEVVEHALEPFYTTKTASGGTGLGLSQVYGFAKQSGGHVNIYSEPGHGTTVKLYLPRASGHDRSMEAQPEASETVPQGTETILVVEDNSDVRRLVEQQLRELGYTVHSVRNAAEALRFLDNKTHIDLLYTDVVLAGGMTGYELAELANQRRPDLKMAFTSGYTAIGIAEEFFGHAEGPMLSKPYRKRELARFIRSALEQSG